MCHDSEPLQSGAAVPVPSPTLPLRRSTRVSRAPERLISDPNGGSNLISINVASKSDSDTLTFNEAMQDVNIY